MVLLAATLHRGLREVVQRRTLLVKGAAVLQCPAGVLVYRASSPLTSHDG
ncbi:hypothetical protein [Micromonospora arborensis]